MLCPRSITMDVGWQRTEMVKWHRFYSPFVSIASCARIQAGPYALHKGSIVSSSLATRYRAILF